MKIAETQTKILWQILPLFLELFWTLLRYFSRYLLFSYNLLAMFNKIKYRWFHSKILILIKITNAHNWAYSRTPIGEQGEIEST